MIMSFNIRLLSCSGDGYIENKDIFKHFINAYLWFAALAWIRCISN